MPNLPKSSFSFIFPFSVIPKFSMSYAISVLNVPQDICGPCLFLDTVLKANSQIRTKGKFLFIFDKR